jgi:hypothetical protein
MVTKIRAFHAYGKGGYASVTRDTPRAAAEAFFMANPQARKCSVTEGFEDGAFFNVVYGNCVYPGETEARWPRRWKDVTKRTLDLLPVDPVKREEAAAEPIPNPL